MTISQVRRQSRRASLVRSRRIQEAFPAPRPLAEPGPALPLLPACLAERCRTHQRLPGVCPPIRMRLLLVVLLQEPAQPLLELRRRGEVPPLEEAPGQHTEPQLHLVQPRSVLGRKHEAMGIVRVTQEGPPLTTVLQGPWAK